MNKRIHIYERNLTDKEVFGDVSIHRMRELTKKVSIHLPKKEVFFYKWAATPVCQDKKIYRIFATFMQLKALYQDSVIFNYKDRIVMLSMICGIHDNTIRNHIRAMIALGMAWEDSEGRLHLLGKKRFNKLLDIKNRQHCHKFKITINNNQKDIKQRSRFLALVEKQEKQEYRTAEIRKANWAIDPIGNQVKGFLLRYGMGGGSNYRNLNKQECKLAGSIMKEIEEARSKNHFNHETIISKETIAKSFGLKSKGSASVSMQYQKKRGWLKEHYNTFKVMSFSKFDYETFFLSNPPSFMVVSKGNLFFRFSSNYSQMN